MPLITTQKIKQFAGICLNAKRPDEISVPPRVKVADGWGFAIAKLSEELQSP